MAKISIAKVKSLLTKGTEYTAEFIGRNANRCHPGGKIARRRVISNNSKLISLFLDGPYQGMETQLDWKWLTAEEREGSIYLRAVEDSFNDGEFLKITIV